MGFEKRSTRHYLSSFVLLLSPTPHKQRGSSKLEAVSMETSPAQVVLALAHMLRQNSLSYEIEKNKVLDRSVEIAEGFGRGAGTVHIVLTGSPRPTFAETNAYLLDQHRPRRDSADETLTQGRYVESESRGNSLLSLT